MCVRPMNVREMVVPCGKCFECKRRDRSDWTIRLQDEFKQGYFYTLTYNNENLPKNKRVDKEEIKLFLKALRERIRRKDETFNFKYFIVGEYGGRFSRAHYHLITNYSNIDIIRNVWNKGYVDSRKINNARCNYVTKYIQKNIGWRKDDKREKGEKEFRLMSKGLGKPYIEKYGKQHRNDLLMHRVVYGKSYAMPRYYKEKIFKEIIRKEVDKETGEIIMKVIQQEKEGYRKEVEKRKLEKLKKLNKFYKGLLKSEIDKGKRKSYEKYQQKFDSLIKLQQVKMKKNEY